jgi:hypothetical protein
MRATVHNGPAMQGSKLAAGSGSGRGENSPKQRTRLRSSHALDGRGGEPAAKWHPGDGALVGPFRLMRDGGGSTGAGDGHGTASVAGGEAHAALASALQVTAVAALVGLVGGGDVEGEPPQQRVRHVLGQGGEDAESFAGHGEPPSVDGSRHPPGCGRAADTIDAHLCGKVKSPSDLPQAGPRAQATCWSWGPNFHVQSRRWRPNDRRSPLNPARRSLMSATRRMISRLTATSSPSSCHAGTA